MYHSQGKEKKLFSGLTREEMKNLCIIHRGGDKGPCFLDSLARGRRACTSFIGGGEEVVLWAHLGGKRACLSFTGEGKEAVFWTHLRGKEELVHHS